VAFNTISYAWHAANGTLSGPARRVAALTYSDTVDIVDAAGKLDPPRKLRALAAGTVRVLPIDNVVNGGSTVDIPLTLGETLEILPQRVYNTGTTIAAGSLLGIW
jgi:hypothetical protein